MKSWPATMTCSTAASPKTIRFTRLSPPRLVRRSTFFELGAGTGRIMLPLVQAGHRVVGVDESGEMLDIAARHLRPFPSRNTP